MRPPRLRLRTLMILVAVAGVALGVGSAIGRRHLHYRQRSVHYEALAGTLSPLRIGSWVHLRGSRPSSVDRYASPGECLGAYYRGLAAKYRAAAAWPWWPVAADPPPTCSPECRGRIDDPVPCRASNPCNSR